MVLIDFERPGLDCSWTVADKGLDQALKCFILVEESANTSQQSTQLDDPASTHQPHVQDKDHSGLLALSEQALEIIASDDHELEPQQDQVEEPLSEVLSCCAEQEDLSVPALSHEEDAAERKGETKLAECRALPFDDSQPRFFNCFSWLTKLMSGPDRSRDQESDLERALRESATMTEAQEVSAAEGRARLQSVMDKYNMKARPVLADGNCQFRALSQQLYGHEDQHGHIRARMVEQLKSTPSRYGDFVHEPFGEYVERVSRNGEWGDNVTLQATSDMLGVDIHVLTDQPGAEHIELHATEQGTASGPESLWLSFLSEVHYDAVEPLCL